MIYMHRVKYTRIHKQHEREESVLFYSKEKEIFLDSDFVRKVVLVAGEARDHFQYGYSLKEIISTEFLREIVFLYGSVTLSDGQILNIPETRPMVKDSEIYYIENILKVKKPTIISDDLKESEDKILFIADESNYNYKCGDFKSLTHEEMSLLSSLEVGLYKSTFKAKEVVKNLL